MDVTKKAGFLITRVVASFLPAPALHAWLSPLCVWCDSTLLPTAILGESFRRCLLRVSRTHPSRDVIFFGQISAKKTPEIISVHDVWKP